MSYRSFVVIAACVPCVFCAAAELPAPDTPEAIEDPSIAVGGNLFPFFQKTGQELAREGW